MSMEFNVLSVISERNLSSQSLALVLTIKQEQPRDKNTVRVARRKTHKTHSKANYPLSQKSGPLLFLW